MKSRHPAVASMELLPVCLGFPLLMVISYLEKGGAGWCFSHCGAQVSHPRSCERADSDSGGVGQLGFHILAAPRDGDAQATPEQRR
jgi:hypothetical protein